MEARIFVRALFSMFKKQFFQGASCIFPDFFKVPVSRCQLQLKNDFFKVPSSLTSR